MQVIHSENVLRVHLASKSVSAAASAWRPYFCRAEALLFRSAGYFRKQARGAGAANMADAGRNDGGDTDLGSGEFRHARCRPSPLWHAHPPVRCSGRSRQRAARSLIASRSRWGVRHLLSPRIHRAAGGVPARYERSCTARNLPTRSLPWCSAARGSRPFRRCRHRGAGDRDRTIRWISSRRI